MKIHNLCIKRKQFQSFSVHIGNGCGQAKWKDCFQSTEYLISQRVILIIIKYMNVDFLYLKCGIYLNWCIWVAIYCCFTVDSTSQVKLKKDTPWFWNISKFFYNYPEVVICIIVIYYYKESMNFVSCLITLSLWEWKKHVGRRLRPDLWLSVMGTGTWAMYPVYWKYNLKG